MTESDAYLALNMVPDVGAVTARAGIEVFGSARAFFLAGGDGLSRVRGVGRVRAAKIAAALATADWRGERQRASSSRVTVVTQADPAYPPALRTLHSPPLALYVAGDPAALSAPCLAIVGTRSPTMYGRERARDFAYRAALAGFVVVSGLARGVDTEAAEGALLARGRTVAVIGSALDRLYPPENRELARRIVAAGGAVVSEYPFGRQADRQTFPMRNRIVSGLSLGVLCVEAGVTSGTLITADHAMEQGRSVMALPGRVTDPSALGCLRLIQQGARLVISPDDVIDELSSLPGFSAVAQSAAADAGAAADAPPPPRQSALQALPETHDPDERTVLAALAAESGLDADSIARRAAVPAATLAPLMIGLEMKGLVKLAPDGTYSLRRPRRGP
ncbi:MAG: DNA-processing protein DprA [Kiritimatiellae bacterium]|nr:DNA-processing protein DprA [Kiritimatiellia bacterium]